jgi:tRNA isopentenyl-2-thiomethyl-A-37 hydroxylase MiaE
MKKEIIKLFVNTFKAPYFEHLVRSSAQHFSDMVAIAERIEQAIHLGRIVDSTKEKYSTREKKETEVHNVKGGYKNKRKSYQNKDI